MSLLTPKHAQDEDRLKQAVNTAPTHAELNARLARSPGEAAAWADMDAQPELWLPPPPPPAAMPHFLRYDADDVRQAVTANSKLRPDQVTASHLTCRQLWAQLLPQRRHCSCRAMADTSERLPRSLAQLANALRPAGGCTAGSR